jgi:oxygen-dependent protoporphyrinogen oxidase
LAAIPYVGLNVVHTAFLKSEIDHPLDGFGFLVPRREQLSLLGSVWISRLFPERAMDYYHLFTSYLGGAHRSDIADWDEERLVAEVSRELSAVLRTRNPLKAVFSRVVRHEKAIPQYTVGHRTRLQTVDWALAQHPGLALCGNYLQGIALNECVKSGLRAAGVEEKAIPC